MGARWTAVVAGGLLAGTAATIAKGKAEGLLQPLAERVWPPGPADKQVPGADPAGHPDRMPPTEIAQRADAVLTAGASEDDSVDAMPATLHWTMGVGAAVVYSLLAARNPKLRAGFGAPSGLALYALTHASALPAAGLQPYPWQMPRAAVAWEAGSHAIYGLVLDVALRIEDQFGL